VRTTLIAATSMAVLLITLAVANLHAQGPGPGQGQGPAHGGSPVPTSHGVAVIDINYIYDKYSRFQQDVEGWKRDSEHTAGQFKKEEDAIVKQIESMKTLKPGTKEFKALEEEITHKKSDLEINAQLKKKEFAEAAARLQLKAYQEITAAVKAYAERNGISLVLQFNGAPVDQNNPRAVQAELSKLVVYQNGIDITPIILDDLNRRAAATAGPRRPPAGQPTKQR
jgi:Skp family chaperone for outer membrane proteins